MAESKKILVVDDEPKIVEVLERYLADEGFIVSKAYDGMSAVESFKAQQPDLVLLDLKLPGMSGLDAFAQMRAEINTPIIMLTSRTDEIDRILGLELGADDYITKPFSPREVVARVKTVLRRLAQTQTPGRFNGPWTSGTQERSQEDTSQRIVVGSLEIDREDHEVRIDGR